MSQRDDLLYLVHIKETIRLIEQTAGDRGKEAFLADADIRDATLYRLQTLAESTQRLSQELKARHVAVPWADIAGFRHRVVHAYLGVDLEIVWDIVGHSLSDLRRCVELELLRRAKARPGPAKEKNGPEIDTGLGIGF